LGAGLVRPVDRPPHPEGYALHSYRIVVGRITAGLLTLATATLSMATIETSAQAAPRANSHWTWCNENAVGSAPSVLWIRMQSATDMHSDIPSAFWSNTTYRDDIAKIAC
jgi:hypothetical protein